MKKITYILIVFLLSQCTSTNKDDNWCNEMNEKSMDYIYNFQIYEDSIYLDSALNYTDSALKYCNKLKLLFTFRKLDILSKKRDYSEVIAYIKSFKEPIFIDLPYYNTYLLNRYIAIQNQLDEDLIHRNDYIKTNIYMVKQFMLLNNDKIDSMYKSENIEDILQNPLHFAPIQYYYNKSIIYGYDSIKIELDSLQAAKNINKEYVDYIEINMRNDFLDFVGY